jgi:tetratricopeptide (TPR) repeat protein
MKLMKKFMMMAIMLVASATAFAGDSDALKAILKAKTYAEAETLLNSSLASLASDAEKAKAYNKLVDLAYEAFMTQSTIETENQLNKQMGKEEKPVDVQLMAEMAYNALAAAQECDKYDQMPNEKGKVAPKFAEKNAQRLWTNIRNQLVNSGQDALQAKDNALARKYWQMFTLSDAFPFFKNCDREAQKPFFGQVARFAAIFAYQDKDMDMANKLADIAMKDPEEYENAINLKMEIMGDGLTTKEDSVNYINNLKTLYAEHKTNGIMEKLYNMLSATGEKAAAEKILDDALAADPNNFVALADKGMGLLNDNPAEASNYLKKAYDIKSDNALLATYLATSLSMQAQNIEDPAKKKELYKEAIVYFDKAKELDPERLQANWGYNRYNAYYNYYGEDAAETKQAEADYKY